MTPVTGRGRRHVNVRKSCVREPIARFRSLAKIGSISASSRRMSVPKGNRGGTGRPPVYNAHIPNIVRGLGERGATEHEVADVLGISDRTLRPHDHPPRALPRHPRVAKQVPIG